MIIKNEPFECDEDEKFISHTKTGLLVSNKGRVYFDTNVSLVNVKRRHSQFLKKTLMKNGYYTVSFGGSHVYIHRLVADCFIENPLNKTHVNHKDLDKTNNLSSNLEWTSHIENINHAIKGDKYSVKLKRKDVICIRESIETIKELSVRYNVSDTNIRLIINKKIWKHV